MDTTSHLYSHRATSFEHEGVKSLAQGDTPADIPSIQFRYHLKLGFMFHFCYNSAFSHANDPNPPPPAPIPSFSLCLIITDNQGV